MTARGSLFLRKTQFLTFLNVAACLVFKDRAAGGAFLCVLSIKSVKAYTAKGNVQQNGRAGTLVFKTVLKNGSNLHLVYPFFIKNFRQRKIE